MNIQSRQAIQQHAQKAVADSKDESACRYEYGSEERNIWIDAFALALAPLEAA
jgi:hypothetical protein